jgi:hypothetical protein
MNLTNNIIKAVHPRILEIQGKYKKVPLPLEFRIKEIIKNIPIFKIKLETIYEKE